MILPMTKTSNDRTIKIQCPTCKSTKDVNIPESSITGTGPMTTFSVPKGAVCEHHFQLFLDKNFRIRGYQKVDFEFTDALQLKKDKEKQKQEHSNKLEKLDVTVKNDKDLFENLTLEGNFMEYIPSTKTNLHKKKVAKEKSPQKMESGEMTIKKTKESKPEKEKIFLKEIYDDFWELIADDHPDFQEFILKDKRRKKSKLKLELEHSY